MKRVLMILALAALVAGGAFAQRVGDTWQVGGQTWTVQRIDGNTMTMQKVLTLDGAWANSSGNVYTINGATGVLTTFNSTDATWQDALRKGFFKVGDQFFRNLRKTGDLTWSGQALYVEYNDRAPDVAIRVYWSNETLTMSADGRTLSYDGGRTVWLTRR